MASFNNFVLLIMFTISLNILVAEAGQKSQEIPSEEEKKILEMQLRAINKPAIKSFKTEQGEIFDCIDIHKQLAFDHHLLKNHTVQVKPTTVPKWITRNNVSEKVGYMQNGISCPDGTVIVKRITTKDLLNERHLKSIGLNSPRNVHTKGSNGDITGHHYATIQYEHSTIFGVKGNMNLWDPPVSQAQASFATMAIAGGPEQVASITVGWGVHPLIYGDHVHLYTYWTVDGFDKTGCYDIRCPGFVQVSKKIPVGVLVHPVSVYNGRQYDIDLALHQDRGTGDWWLVFGGENVGYWPASLFKASPGLVKGANFANWGGQVYSPLTERSPLMGSGHFPNEGYGKSAFTNNIQIIDGSGTALIPQIYTIKTYESSPNCYKAKYIHQGDDVWMRAVYYGGPGGCTGKTIYDQREI